MHGNYLEHYGVPGMRWGVRRSSPTLRLTGPSSGSKSSTSQGPTGGRSSSSKKKKGPKIVDVDYTEVGGSGGKKAKTKKQTSSGQNGNNNTQSNQTSKTETKSFDVNGAKNGLRTGKQIADAGAQSLAKDRKKNALTRVKNEAKEMSDADLRKMVDRMSLEDRYVSIHEKRGVTDAKSNLEKTLEVAGQVATHAETALSIYNTIQEIRNGRR